jgi:hypothetical protein
MSHSVRADVFRFVHHRWGAIWLVIDTQSNRAVAACFAERDAINQAIKANAQSRPDVHQAIFGDARPSLKA